MPSSLIDFFLNKHILDYYTKKKVCSLGNTIEYDKVDKMLPNQGDLGRNNIYK